jgi:hypothetical protein
MGQPFVLPAVKALKTRSTNAGSQLRRISVMTQTLHPFTGTGSGKKAVVTSVSELTEAARDSDVRIIVVAADLRDVPTIRLAPGTTLLGGASERPSLQFAADTDGLCLSTNNTVAGLDLIAADNRCAIWNDDSVTTLGTLGLRNINTAGRVRILARGKIRGGHVDAENVSIVFADAREEQVRPHGYGVDVLQGAFTLWNMQPDADVMVTANLAGLSAGRLGAPVRGSGIFVGGAGHAGGRLKIQLLRTGPVYSDGGIEQGNAGTIAGGVFVVYGASVDMVDNAGPVTTYGPNDMALDNWGVVDRWISTGNVTTFGPSGVGFVNFGTINSLRVTAPIETFGQGARGFNVYTGTVRSGDFDRIVTHGDGAVGVQISQPIGTLIFRRGIETHGSAGDSLVKGVVKRLAATALSIKPGGSAERIRIEGGIRTHGHAVIPLEQGGEIHSLHIEGGFGGSQPTDGVR